MPPIHNSAPPSFSALAKEILRHLDQRINVPTTACLGLEDHETLGPDKLRDIRTRFILWTGNLGVMHKPDDPRALDRRLVEAPEVACRVREILGDLQDLLSQSERPCDCDASQTSPTEQVAPLDDEDAMMMQLLGLQTSKKCTTSWLAASLDDTLRRLFHLSSLITKSSTRDKFVRAEVKCRLEMYERYDVQHVREKVKLASGRADEGLVKRLGKANTSRRQFIAYAREHNAELSGVDLYDDKSWDQGQTNRGPNGTSDKSSVGQSVLKSDMTKQSAAPTKASTVGLVDPNAFDYGLDDARSCTTVATSIVDGQAFSGLQVPELALYAKPGEPFICPLCQTVQRFNGQVAWRRHIFSDIRAYICTSTKCGMLMFSSFNAWRSHELDHRREWFCPLCNLVFHDKAKARMHIIQHYGTSDDHHIDLLLQTSSRSPEYLSADGCPFCDWSTTLRKRNVTPREQDLTVPTRRFMKHLGRHLEEIALFVVPQPEEGQVDSEDNGSNAVHAAQDEDSATNATLSSFNSNRPYVASIPSQHSRESFNDEANRGLCPYPTCGRHVKDLEAHMLTHHNDRLEKCPFPSCRNHTKGFARIYDRNRHILTHYKGTMVCEFCRNSDTPIEKSFNRVDIFKRHLTSAHGVEQIPPNSRRQVDGDERGSNTITSASAGGCSICGNGFEGAQKFYNHLDSCVLSFIEDQLHDNLAIADITGGDWHNADETANEEDNQGDINPFYPVSVNLASTAYPDDVRAQSSAPSSQSRQVLESGLEESLEDSQPLVEMSIQDSKLDSVYIGKDVTEDFSREGASNITSAPYEHPSHGNHLSAPHHSLVNERMQAANAARSLSPSSAPVERSPFKHGSPLAPIQGTWNEPASRARMSNSQNPSQQGGDFDTTAIMARQASAMKSQESGDEVVPASNTPNTSLGSRLHLPHETPSSIDPLVPVSRNYEGNLKRQQNLQKQALAQRRAQMMAQQRAHMMALQQRRLMLDEELRLEQKRININSAARTQVNSMGQPHLNMVAEAESPQRRSDFATDLPRTISPKHALFDFDAAASSADIQPPLDALQQSQPSAIPKPEARLSSAFADELTSAPATTPAYPLQLATLEEEVQSRLLMAPLERNPKSSQPGWATGTAMDPANTVPLHRQANTNSHAMSYGQTRDFFVYNRSKSALGGDSAPHQAHVQPSVFAQTPVHPQDRTPTASTSHQWNAQAEIAYQQSARAKIEALIEQNNEIFEKARREWTLPTTPLSTLPPSQNISDAQPRHAWQTADNYTVFPSYGLSREDAHVNFAKSVAERTSQPSPMLNLDSSGLREGLHSVIPEDIDALDQTDNLFDMAFDNHGRLRRNASFENAHPDDRYVPTAQRSNNPSPPTIIPGASHHASPHGEERFKASDHMAAISEASEVHRGHDAMKVLYEAAILGRVDSSAVPQRPSYEPYDHTREALGSASSAAPLRNSIGFYEDSPSPPTKPEATHSVELPGEDTLQVDFNNRRIPKDPANSLLRWRKLINLSPQERRMRRIGACLYCQQRRVKCELGINGCLRCERVNRPCEHRDKISLYKQAEDARQIAGLGQNLSSDDASNVAHDGAPPAQNLISGADQQSIHQNTETEPALSSHSLPRVVTHAEFVAGKLRDNELLEDPRDGFEKAWDFREKDYPANINLYDDLSERQAKSETVDQDELDRLWNIHKEELKRMTVAAADRGKD